MPDDQRRPDPHDDDAEFRRWRAERNQEAPASVTFMEIMRRAAATQPAPAPDAPADPAQGSPSEGQPLGMTQSAGQAAVDVDTLTEPSPPVIPPLAPPPDDGAGDGDPAPRRRRARSSERRRAARQPVGGSMLGGCLRAFIIIIAAAGLTATIFTWMTPNEFLATDARRGLSAALATQTVSPAIHNAATPNWERRIGIVSGHRGPENDPGAVCPDGLTEAEINFNVAQLVVANLRGRGYTVDLLDEFDPRLNNYQASALVSIHANTCQPFGNERPSGFLIAGAAARITARGADNILVECVAREYGAQTGLARRQGVTVDMTHYHTFREIHPLTPAAIIELGFMLADRALLTEQPDLLAGAITDGVLCFLEPAPLGS